MDPLLHAKFGTDGYRIGTTAPKFQHLVEIAAYREFSPAGVTVYEAEAEIDHDRPRHSLR